MTERGNPIMSCISLKSVLLQKLKVKLNEN